MKVLIVDDNPKSMATAKVHLIKEELEVLCVEDGKNPLEVAQQNKPDLIILDIDMPDIFYGTKPTGNNLKCKLFTAS